MLTDRNVMATIAVKDVNAARRFYEGVLGLKASGGGGGEGDHVVTYKLGNSSLMVYRSEYAGTNKATAATWPVGDDVEIVVEALKAKGVKFEHYDFPGTTRNGDVHIFGTIKAAWFKDPDGNIHNIVNGHS